MGNAAQPIPCASQSIFVGDGALDVPFTRDIYLGICRIPQAQTVSARNIPRHLPFACGLIRLAASRRSTFPKGEGKFCRLFR